MIPFSALVLLSGLIPLSTLACGPGPDGAREAADSAGAPAAGRSAEGEPAAGGGPPPLRVAVTIDDVPWSGRAWDGLDRAAETRRFLAHLTDRDVPFAALITCGNRPPDGSLLPLWLDAGATAGNHTRNHWNLNDTPLDAWLADAASCHDELTEVLGRRPPWFRFPMLHRGPTPERKAAAAALLDSLGTEDAPVTVDNSEWVIAAEYARVAPDPDRDGRFRELYVEHMLAALRHYREMARSKLGRDPAHILLIHANALNARHLGAVLDAYRAEGVEFVSLEEAMADPLYDRPDEYVGPDGLSWIMRVPPVTAGEAAWDQEEEERVRREARAIGG